MKTDRFRLTIQVSSFLLALIFTYVALSICKKTIHTACPYSVVCFGLGTIFQSSILFIVSGIGVILGIVILISTLFWGRVFCAYLCPLGTLSEAIYYVRGKAKRLAIPRYIDRHLLRAKFIVFAVTVFLVISGFAWAFIRFCPMFLTSLIPSIALSGVIHLTLLAILSIALERFWCRYLCPFAALMIIYMKVGNLFGIKRMKVKRNLERCVDCGFCIKSCPMNIDLSESEYINNYECIVCMKCANSCPKPKTITREYER